MEYVDGPSCADLLREHKQLDVEDAVGIVRDACNGLDYAHRAGVVHRDVKPGNLLVARESGATKLADFGIAKAAHQTRITQVGSVLGTAAYLSPEQARGEEAGPESDIYSLGVCTYQFLTGRLPHEYASLTELALKQQEETVDSITMLRPEVPPELDRAVRVCLERDPAARYATALEMGRALDAGLAGVLSEATERLATQSTLPPDDEEATRALSEVTAATQALRTRGTEAPPARTRPPAPERPPRPDRSDRRGRRRRRLGGLFALLAVLLAGAAVALALLAATGNNNADPVNQNDVQQQIDGIKDFLRDHSR
jgi:serine/threonine-protein kinase